MPLHLLGICRQEDIATLPADWPVKQPQANTFNRCALAWLADGPLAAATVQTLPATSGPLEQAAWLAAIHSHISILPVRYGTVLADEEAVGHFLGNRCEDLLRDLVRVEGTGEIGLRVDLADPATPPPSRNQDVKDLPAISPGQYLALRRQRYEWKDRLDRRARLAAENFVQAVHGLYREWRALTSTMPAIVRLAFLVPRDLWGAFRERLEATMPEQASRQCTLLGPWPPYSFV